jgi:hypothetical protein
MAWVVVGATTATGVTTLGVAKVVRRKKSAGKVEAEIDRGSPMPIASDNQGISAES